MTYSINWKKISLFIFISFGISWSVAGVMTLLNLELDSLGGTLLIALLYMPGPAIATFIIQKFIYRKGFKKYGWTFDRHAIKWLLATPLLFLALISLCIGTIALFGNTGLIEEFGRLDFNKEQFNERILNVFQGKLNVDDISLPPVSAELLFILIIIQGIINGATLNVPFMFGEEFGWRGLLLRETQTLGFLKSGLFIGIIWGLWHLPLIIKGHNYPTHPYFGIMMMCIFTTALSPLFSYIRFKTKTILGPCMLHGMINATGILFIIFIADGNELYSSLAGWAGIISGAVITIFIYLLDKKFVDNFTTLV